MRRREILARAGERGCDPLDAMLEALEELLCAARTAGPLDERLILFERASAIAKDAAPYLHPRLAAMAVAQEPSEPSRIGRLTRDELIELLIAAKQREEARRREQTRS